MPAVIAVLIILLIIMGESAERRSSPLPRDLTSDEKLRLRNLAASGQEVQAIREFRQLTGATLKDAVQRVRNLR